MNSAQKQNSPAPPILVTGASGFIGANLCRYLASRGHSVVAVEGTGRHSWRLKNLNQGDETRIRKILLDLTNEGEVRQLLRELQPSAIFNLAAYGAYSNQTDARRIYQVNFDAVRFLLEGARELHQKGGFRAFVQAGSSSEYGFNCKAPREIDATLPDSEYAVSKVAATSLVQLYGKKHQLPAWAFRLYSVYGPFEDVSRLMLKLLLHAKDGHLPPLVNPKISRDFVYVDDVSKAFLQILAQAAALPKGSVYNIGTGTCVTLENLVSITQQTFQIAETPHWGSMPDRHWDHPDWYSDPQKAREELGWQAGIPLAEGLRRTMQWLQANQPLLDEAACQSVLHEIRRETRS